MDYDTAKEQFESAREAEKSAFQRIRRRLATNRVLRNAFDRSYGTAYTRISSIPRVRHRLAPYLDDDTNVVFSRSGTGFSQSAEVAMLSRLGAIRNKDVLLVGVEYGEDVNELWMPHLPRRIIGIDIGDYEAGWRRFLDDPSNSSVPIAFLKMDAAMIGLSAQSVDLVYSQGVLPHITDVVGHLDNASRILREGGTYYAFCCPLWRTFGGSHVHALGYNHLRLTEAEFKAQATALEDGSSWWLELGLFNRLRFRELIDAVTARFDVLRIGVIESPDGRRFRETSPEQWRILLEENDEEDLLIRLVSITARKR